jgi:hypothetical protein
VAQSESSRHLWPLALLRNTTTEERKLPKTDNNSRHFFSFSSYFTQLIQMLQKNQSLIFPLSDKVNWVFLKSVRKQKVPFSLQVNCLV